LRDPAAVEHVELPEGEERLPDRVRVPPGHTSLRAVLAAIMRHWGMFLTSLGALVLCCLLYCLIAPKEFEARTRIALRATPGSPLGIDGGGRNPAASETAAMVQSETVQGFFEAIAWHGM
jgi:uncharacterized protein involved in exopolysaccharide biosynthesis